MVTDEACMPTVNSVDGEVLCKRGAEDNTCNAFLKPVSLYLRWLLHASH